MICLLWFVLLLCLSFASADLLTDSHNHPFYPPPSPPPLPTPLNSFLSCTATPSLHYTTSTVLVHLSYFLHLSKTADYALKHDSVLNKGNKKSSSNRSLVTFCCSHHALPLRPPHSRGGLHEVLSKPLLCREQHCPYQFLCLEKTKHNTSALLVIGCEEESHYNSIRWFK